MSKLSNALEFFESLSPLKIALAGFLLSAVVGGVQQVRIHLQAAELETVRAQGAASLADMTRQRDACFITVREQNDAINAMWLESQKASGEADLRSTQTLLQFERQRQSVNDEKITGPKDMTIWMQHAFQ